MRNRQRLALVLVLVVVPLVVGAGVAWENGTFDGPIVPRPGARPWAARRTLAGLENFGEVIPGKVYRGAQPTAEGFEELRKLGVKTVINLRLLHDEAAAVTSVGLEALRVPLQADIRGSTPPTADEVARFLRIVLDPSKQPVYFHCAHGKDRTGTMCAVLRMEVQGWTNAEVYDEMQHFGFNKIWEDLEAFVRTYKPLGRWREEALAVTATAPVQSPGVNALERRSSDGSSSR